MDKYAIILTGGKQFKAAVGDKLYIEKTEAEEGAEYTFDKVLAVADGEQANFGAPYVEGATVTAEVVKHGKGKKIRIIKFKAKKGYKKRQGHRQPYTLVEIKAINA